MEKTTNLAKTKEYITNLLKARFPFIYISTWEEGRVTELIQEIASDEEKIKTLRTVYTWTQTQGLECDYEKVGKEDTRSPKKVLEFIDDCDEAAIFILKDFHVYLGVPGKAVDYEIVRQLRDLALYLKNSGKPKNIIFISPSLILPNELQKDVTIVNLDFPSME